MTEKAPAHGQAADAAPSAVARTEFDRLPTAPRRARQYVTVVLGALYVPAAVAERAVLVTSELMTNAVRHGAAGPVRLALDLRGDVLTLTVSDRTPYVPLPDAELPDAYAESGRGLALVEALSARWGHRPTADPDDGTEVWAELTGAGA